MVLPKSVVSAIALGSALVAAVPTATSKGFSVDQIAVPRSKPRAPVTEYEHALRKYNAKVPQAVAGAASRAREPPTAAAAAESGTATNNPTSGDEEYITPVTVGQGTLNLDFDTGSADLWVFSSETPTDEAEGHQTYVPSSSAKKVSGATWNISYGDGSSASGNVYDDTVTVGGVSYATQAVEAAEQVSSEFTQDTSSDGLLGLAFSSINTVQPTPQKTFFDNVQGSLAKPLFAATLKHDAPGTYDFGFIDSSRYTGDISYTTVDNSQGFWGFTTDGYSINNKSAGSGITGIADTGTTLLLLDDSVVEAYYKEVSGAQNDESAGGYVFDCSATLPDFSVTIGSYEAVVPAEFINFGSVSSGSSSCFGGIQSNEGVGFSIFGDVFLKSQYVVFDSDGPQLGFAAQA